MPSPINAAEFLVVVEKSGLLQGKDLDRYRSRSESDSGPPDQVANRLVEDGRLTPFQVELLLAGKYRPFFVGPYKVMSRIGNGSMGVVYLCEHQQMRRRVALKVLQKRRANDKVALERFVREARAAAALSHPNVVHALDVGHENGMHFLVMEYIAGQSLKELILNEGPLPPLKAALYLRQAALGVQHAHEAGLIHRDIKPSNLMIDKSGVVKLLDLGFARFDDAEFSLTRGTAIGDAAYIAPEQAVDSHAVDARADIYSLGATFYLALVGRPIIPGAGITDANPSQQSDTSDFSRLMAILRRMTAPDRANRYQTAAEVVAELAAWPAPNPPMGAAVSPTQSSDTESKPSATPLTFEVSTQRKTTIPAKPWWLVRRWQLLVLGTAVALGFLAALVGNAR